MALHKDVTPSAAHTPYRAVFADDAERTGDVGPYTAADVTAKINALQVDTLQDYVLTNHSPITWTPKGGGGGGSGAPEFSTTALLTAPGDNGTELAPDTLYIALGALGGNYQLPASPALGTRIGIWQPGNGLEPDASNTQNIRIDSQGSDIIFGLGASQFTDTSVWYYGTGMLEFIFAGDYGVFPGPAWIAQQRGYDYQRAPGGLPVRLCAGVPLPTFTPSGSFGGESLTATANGALVVDGVAVQTGHSVLVNGEHLAGGAGGEYNGIYVCGAPGDGGTPFVLWRRYDFIGPQHGEVGRAVYILAGDAFAGRIATHDTSNGYGTPSTHFEFTASPERSVEDNAFGAGPHDDFGIAGQDGATSIELQITANATLRGIAAPLTPWSPRTKRIVVKTSGGFYLRLLNEDSNPTAANRLRVPFGSIVAVDNTVLTAVYDDTDQRWYISDTGMSERVSLVDGVNISCDITAGRNFIVTLGGNRTLDFPKLVPGARGQIVVVQDGTGGRTLAMGTNAVAPGGAITLSAGAGAFDLLDYFCDESGGAVYVTVRGLDFQ